MSWYLQKLGYKRDSIHGTTHGVNNAKKRLRKTHEIKVIRNRFGGRDKFEVWSKRRECDTKRFIEKRKKSYVPGNIGFTKGTIKRDVEVKKLEKRSPRVKYVKSMRRWEYVSPKKRR